MFFLFARKSRRESGRDDGKMNLADRAICPHSLADARSAACRTSRLCLPASVWAALLCLTLPAMADFRQANVPKLTASDPVGSAERQGFSVAVSADGNTAIIGAPFDSSGAGAAWVFTRSVGTWTQRQKLTADDAAGCSQSNLSVCPQFGWSVALSADGNTAIVGGPGDNGSIGAAWVFTQSNAVWSNPGVKLTGTGAVGNAEQGYSVALSADGTTAIVGGWADNSALGAAWVFRWSGTRWNQQGARLVGTGATATTNILQGFSVALSGDGNLAIIGGPNDGIILGPKNVVLDAAIGAAWLFRWSSGSWTQEAKLVGMNGSANGSESEQGFSVALSRDGSTAVVGGPGEETPGPGTSGAISQTCSSGGTSPTCPNGTIAGTTETTVNMSKGAAWVFRRSSGIWGPPGGTMLVGTPTPGSNPGQGFSVALSDTGNTMLLGGPTDNANTGAAWAFTLRSGTWTAQAKALVGTGAVGAAGQGASVALSGDGITAIIGGALDHEATGAAWAFVSKIITHDFNGDGMSDILWRDIAGDVGVWLMNGTTISSGTVIGNVPDSWMIAGQHDFNGDGSADILWRDASGNVAIWLMNGTTPLSQILVANVPTTWTIVGTGDFNGDGMSDILWRDNSGNVAIWLMNGTSILSTAVVANVPAIWAVAGTADFNGDGMTDILWRDSSGDVAIWLMNSTVISTAGIVTNVPANWSIVGTGDFNSDGRSDILWRDTSGNVAIWLMNGMTLSSSTVVANVPTNWSIAETGDFNGDGMSDILWRDTSGDVAIWLMNGTTISSGTVIANLPNLWAIQTANAD